MNATKLASEPKKQKSLLDFYQRSQKTSEEIKDPTLDMPSASESSGKRKRGTHPIFSPVSYGE